MSGSLLIESFDPHRHDVAGFVCGQPSLDSWLRRYAGQGERRSTSRTFVLARSDDTVAGYYTLVAGAVDHDDTTAQVVAGTSRHFPIPVGVIARLAVDEREQGRGLGAELLRNALTRLTVAAEHIGIRAVVVDAIDDHAARFYEHFGFAPVAAMPSRLMVPVTAVIRSRRPER